MRRLFREGLLVMVRPLREGSFFDVRTILLVALILGLSPAVHAAEDPEALIRHGVALRRRGDDAAALQEFRRAYDLAPSPRAVAQMGLAEQQMQSWVDATKHLTEALQGRADPWIKKNRTVLETSLKTVESHVARVQIGGEPAGADVLLNGQRAGTLPLREPSIVPPGPVRVEVRNEGYVSSTLSIVVAAGDLNRTEVRLERERSLERPLIGARPSEGGAGLHQVGRAMLPQPPPVDVVHDQQDDEKPPEPTPNSAVHTARWIALGFTAVFAAGGTAGFLIREQNVKNFNLNKCSIDSRTGNLMSPTGQGTNCRAWAQNADTAKTVGMVGLVGAGLLAVTSAVLFFAF
jgi:hypothetical protein